MTFSQFTCHQVVTKRAHMFLLAALAYWCYYSLALSYLTTDIYHVADADSPRETTIHIDGRLPLTEISRGRCMRMH